MNTVPKPYLWLIGSRPQTWAAAIAPVLVGCGEAIRLGGFSLPRALLALLVALALQIGVNYANDYSDGIKGTDLNRVGPLRLTASGSFSSQAVKRAAFLSFGVASLAGLWLVSLAGAWWLVIVGLLAVIAAWTYTGGKRPYGYLGLGEVGVFVFFGLVAVAGTVYTQVGSVSSVTWLAASGIGLIACAILMVNNIRDLPKDRLVGKNTLAVRLDERNARIAYAGMVLIPLLLNLIIAFTAPWVLITLVLWVPGLILAIGVLLGARGRLLVPFLVGTGMYELSFGILLAIGLGAGK